MRVIIQVQSFISKCLSFRLVSFVQGYRLCIEKLCTWIILSLNYIRRHHFNEFEWYLRLSCLRYITNSRPWNSRYLSWLRKWWKTEHHWDWWGIHFWLFIPNLLSIKYFLWKHHFCWIKLIDFVFFIRWHFLQCLVFLHRKRQKNRKKIMVNTFRTPSLMTRLVSRKFLDFTQLIIGTQNRARCRET